MNKLDRIVEEGAEEIIKIKHPTYKKTMSGLDLFLEMGKKQRIKNVLKHKIQEIVEEIFEEIWRRECPKCGYPELIVTEWRSSCFPERVGNGFIAMCPKCGSKFTGTLVLTENLEKQFGVGDD